MACARSATRPQISRCWWRARCRSIASRSCRRGRPARMSSRRSSTTRWSAGNLDGSSAEESMKSVTRLAAAVGLAVAFGACNTGPNPTDEVTKALKQAKLNEVSVDWDGGARVAHLRGRVDQPTDRQRAEEIAAAAVGTTGKVLNEVTIKGLTEKTAGDLDGDIKSTLKKMVDDDPVLRDRTVKFDVNNGAVTVKGEVQTADEKAKLTQLVHAAPGVKDFVNAVEIKPKS